MSNEIPPHHVPTRRLRLAGAVFVLIAAGVAVTAGVAVAGEVAVAGGLVAVTTTMTVFSTTVTTGVGVGELQAVMISGINNPSATALAL